MALIKHEYIELKEAVESGGGLESLQINAKEKALKIRAHLLLLRWARWCKLGLGVKGYPTKPVWQHLIGDTDDMPEDLEAEEVNNLLKSRSRPDRIIISTFYADLYYKVKRKRELPKATRIKINGDNEIYVTTQKVNDTINEIKELIIRDVIR